jgi:phosphoribosylformylglycinamidine synthase
LGVVGLLDSADRLVQRTFQRSGDAVILLGESRAELGGSEYLHTLHGLTRGLPPVLDLQREAALQRLLVDGIAAGLIRSAHDCAEGGLAITLAECCFGTGLGVQIDVPAVATDVAPFVDDATLFGESASRAVVSAAPEDVSALLALAAAAGLPARQVGSVAGERIQIAIDNRPVVDELVADAERIWSRVFHDYFERNRPVA